MRGTFWDMSEKTEKRMVHTPAQSIHFKGYKLLKSHFFWIQLFFFISLTPNNCEI